MENRSILFFQIFVVIINVLFSDGKSLRASVISNASTTPGYIESYHTNKNPTSTREWDEAITTNSPNELKPDTTWFSSRENYSPTKKQFFDEQDSFQGTEPELSISTTTNIVGLSFVDESDRKFPSTMIKLENNDATERVPIIRNSFTIAYPSTEMMTTQTSITLSNNTISEVYFGKFYSIQEPTISKADKMAPNSNVFLKNTSEGNDNESGVSMSFSNNSTGYLASPTIKTSTSGPVTISTLNIGNATTLWPVKHASVMEGDVVLGGLMMVHSREDSITCGPIMPQGGIQALEAMLYTLDQVNENQLLPDITLGAHILDDCDKDTYGLEMAVDFIKGTYSNRYTYIFPLNFKQRNKLSVSILI